MLKTFLIICAVIVNINHGMPTNLKNFQTLMNKIFLKTVKEKCYQNATGTEYEEFAKLYSTSFECYENQLRTTPIFVTPLEEYKEHIQECFENSLKELERCLPEESKDWPRMNLDLVYAGIGFTYENKDQLLNPKFGRYIGNCVENFQEDKAKVQVLQCLTVNNTDPYTAKSVCNVITEVGNCTMTQLSKICPADPDTEELKQNLLEALNEPCLKLEATENPEENLFTLVSPYAPPNMNPELM